MEMGWAIGGCVQAYETELKLCMYNQKQAWN